MGRNVLSKDPKHEKLRKIVYRGEGRSAKRSHRFVEPGMINVYPEAHPDKIMMVKFPGAYGFSVVLERDFHNKIEKMFEERMTITKRSDFYTFKFEREADEVLFRMTFL